MSATGALAPSTTPAAARRSPFPAWWLLNLLQALFLGSWSVFWMSAAVISCIVTRRSDTSLRWGRTWWSPGLLKAAGVTLDVQGLEGIDWSKPHVFVANHQSMIDIPVMFVALPVNLHFIAKAELFLVPFLGWYMRASGMIPVDRNNPDQAKSTLNRSALRVKNGENILAFVEGTRSRDGVIRPFKKGAFVLALQAQVPVVPVAIEGAQRCLPADGFAVRPATIRVRFGTPIPTAGKSLDDKDALIKAAHAAVVAMNLDLGGPGGPSM
jgi:1-acyl-sn-glycerol-3-phosphate acyltransferase